MSRRTRPSKPQLIIATEAADASHNNRTTEDDAKTKVLIQIPVKTVFTLVRDTNNFRTSLAPINTEAHKYHRQRNYFFKIERYSHDERRCSPVEYTVVIHVGECH
jgi:hypothetical protein